MKFLSLFILLIITSTFIYSQKTVDAKTDSLFTLSFSVVGWGSNMFKLQPVFKVVGTQFIYTSEMVWQFKNAKKAKPDTLQIGDFRMSSIDSILNIAKEIKGDSVFAINPWVMSGKSIYLNISSPSCKLKFDLSNSFNSTAQKITDILNSYIQDKYRKLHLSDQAASITKIM